MAMDPIIRSAALQAVRRPLRRPAVPAGSSSGPVLPVDPAAAAAPVDVAVSLAQPLPPVEDIFHEAETARTAARALLAEAEARRAAWQEEERAGQARAAAAAADLAQRERKLAEAQQAYDRAAATAHDDAAARGYAEGLARGSAAGKADADAARTERVARLDTIAAGMADAAAAAVAAHEDMLLEVVWTALCRMAGELAVTRPGTLALIRTAVAQVREGRELRVRVHPQDAAWLQQEHGAPATWTLQPDPAVALGGCIVETGHGTLDARLELQLQRLGDALRDARAARIPAER